MVQTISAGDLVKLRTTKHATQLFLAVYRPAIAAYGRAGQNNPPGDVSIGLYDWTEPRPYYRDYLVNVSHDTPGMDDLGFSRLRQFTGAGGIGTLEIAPANIDSNTDDYYAIMEYVPPMSIRPRQQASGVIKEDWNVAYTNQNSYLRQMICFGPPACAWRDPVTGLASVWFEDGSAHVDSQTWYLPGSDTVNRTDDEFWSTWDTAGQYYCNHSITYDGHTYRGFRPVFIFDPPGTGGTQPISDFSFESLEGSADNAGWSGSFTIYGEASLANFPHQAQVVLFARDWYGDTEESIGGYPGRENIVFTGWIRKRSMRRDYRKRVCSFQVDGIGPLMAGIAASACNLKQSATPGWHNWTTLTSNQAARHIVIEHSTVGHIADIELQDIWDGRDRIDMTETSLLEQLQDQIYTASRGRVISDRQSKLHFESYPQLFIQSARPADYYCELTVEDLLTGEVDFGDESEEFACNHLDFTGIHYTAAGGLRNYYSFAPLNVLATGSIETVDGILVDSQADANQIAGAFFAWLNAGYKDITLQLKGNWRVFDLVPTVRVLLTLTAAQTPKGEAWTQVPLWVKRVSYEYRPGTGLLTTIVCERNAGRVRGFQRVLEDPTLDADAGNTLTEPVLIPYVAPLSISPGGMYAVSTYDLDGGLHESFSTPPPEQGGLYCRASYNKLMLSLDEDGTWDFYANGVKRLEAVRSGGDWSLSVYDDTATLVESVTSATLGSNDLMHYQFANAIVLANYATVRAECTPATSATEYSWCLSCGAD